MQNGGPSKARNIGIDYTIDETDIYAILDADDWMKSSKITHVSVLKKSPMIELSMQTMTRLILRRVRLYENTKSLTVVIN